MYLIGVEVSTVNSCLKFVVVIYVTFHISCNVIGECSSLEKLCSALLCLKIHFTTCLLAITLRRNESSEAVTPFKKFTENYIQIKLEDSLCALLGTPG